MVYLRHSAIKVCGEIAIPAKTMLTVVLIADGKWQMGKYPESRQETDYIQSKKGLNFPTLLF